MTGAACRGRACGAVRLVGLLALCMAVVRARADTFVERAPARHDGRAPRGELSNELLLVPRLVLALPRLVLRGIAFPLGWALRQEERHRIYERVIEALTSADGRFGVRLAFEFASDRRPIAGLSFFADEAFGKGTTLTGRAMIGGPDLVVAELHAGFRLRRFLRIDVDPAYRRRDDQIFQGIRSLTPPGVPLVRSRFALWSFDAPLRLQVEATRWLRIEAVLEYASRRYANGYASAEEPSVGDAYCKPTWSQVPLSVGGCARRTPELSWVPGFENHAHLFRGGLALRVDTRGSAASPRNGVLLELGASYVHGLHDASSYFRVSAGGGLVVDLYQSTHLLVLRLRMDMVLATGAAPIPFSELPMLGGPDDLRGFPAGRFRDFSSLLAQMEYRWKIWMWADAILFVDYGGTSGERYADFDWSRHRPGIGAGVRVRTSSRVFVRFQVAYGFSEGVQLYLSTTPGP